MTKHENIIAASILGVSLIIAAVIVSRAKTYIMVGRSLKKRGYLPGLREEAAKTELEQAELLCADWAG